MQNPPSGTPSINYQQGSYSTNYPSSGMTYPQYPQPAYGYSQYDNPPAYSTVPEFHPMTQQESVPEPEKEKLYTAAEVEDATRASRVNGCMTGSFITGILLAILDFICMGS